ncbi:MAG: aminopeptidase [Thaumarchaeota archaeon]|nr:aminopeptidase [Nitrososphaerota archaeon]
MSDPRPAEHAKIIVNHSCKVKKGDFVLIVASSEANELIREIVSQIGILGAHYIVMSNESSFGRAYTLSADDETLSTLPSQMHNLVRDSDVLIQIIASSNSQEMSDVPPRKMQLVSRAQGPVTSMIQSKRWNITLHPTRALAQDAKMSFESYTDFVYSATLRDWPKMVSEMNVLYDKLVSSRRVRIVGKETDISFSIEGRKPIVDGGEKNLPGGEVFVSPVDSTVNGKVYFDLPIIFNSREIRGARLSFKNGVVVESSAEEGQEFLREMLAADEGARRLGELGIGMNRGINRFTKNILFDEKMGDTIHMAVGLSFEESGGTNKSAIHIDMIKRMKEEGTIYFDDSPIYSNGKFAWE